MRLQRLLLTVPVALLLASSAQAAGPFLFKAKWGTNGSADGQFKSPYHLSVEPVTKNVYVADTQNQRIQKFDENGVFITKWGSFGNLDGQFKNPTGVAADAFGNVYVVDQTNNRIQKFTTTGAFILKWGSFGTGAGQFRAPTGVAVDGAGDVYVADSNNHRVQKFSAGGHPNSNSPGKY